jgi:hypothetical protein
LDNGPDCALPETILDPMRRERLRDFAFITVVVIVLAFVSLAIWAKSLDCSSQGGEFKIYGRGMIECRLADGSVEVP